MAKKLIGLLCIILSLACGGVTALAAFNKPVPVVGPLLGYEPDDTSSTAEVTDDGGDEYAMDESEYTDEDFKAITLIDNVYCIWDEPIEDEEFLQAFHTWLEENPDYEVPRNDTSSESSTAEEEYDDGFNSDVIPDDQLADPTPPVGTGGVGGSGASGSAFMASLEAVALSEMFSKQFTYETTSMTNPYTSYIVFPSDASFQVTATDTGAIEVTTEVIVQSSVTEADLELVYDKELLLAVVYEAISQAQRNAVGEGADYFQKATEGNRLLSMPENPSFEGVKSSLKEGTIDTDKFTILLENVETADYAVTAQLKMRIKVQQPAVLTEDEASAEEESAIIDPLVESTGEVEDTVGK